MEFVNEQADLLLKYFTGNLKQELPVLDISFGWESENTNDDLYNAYASLNEPVLKEIIQAKNGSNEGLGMFILYGNYVISESELGEKTYAGFIILTDSNLNFIQLITKYDTGTELSPFAILKAAEDGTLYGCDYNNSTSKYRFIMLNNIAVKSPQTEEYSINLRASYYFPDTITEMFPTSIYKNAGSSHYLIGCSGIDTHSGESCVISLTINVGSENEWKEYSISGISGLLSFLNIFGEFDSDNNATITALVQSYNTSTDKYSWHIWSYEESSGSSQTYSLGITQHYSNMYSVKSAVVNANKIYLVIYSYGSETYDGTPTDLRLYYISKQSGGTTYSANEVTHETWDAPNNALKSKIEPTIFCDGDNVFIRMTNLSADGTQISNLIYRAVDGFVYGQWWFYSSFVSNPENELIIFGVAHEFNLYSVKYQYKDERKSILQIYNEFNYNGYSYERTNALVPEMGVLLDTNKRPIFARNIFDLTINGATCTSSVEVPNTSLNGQVIYWKSLIGETLKCLCYSPDFLEKNIYETLDINFIDNLVMVNNNNTTNPIYNQLGASFLNKNIRTDDYDGTNYALAKLSKYKVTYTDGSSEIKTIDTSQITLDIVNTKATIEIQELVPATKNITKIELLSNDETTTYCTLDNLGLSLNKNYSIKQDIQINMV